MSLDRVPRVFVTPSGKFAPLTGRVRMRTMAALDYPQVNVVVVSAKLDEKPLEDQYEVTLPNPYHSQKGSELWDLSASVIETFAATTMNLTIFGPESSSRLKWDLDEAPRLGPQPSEEEHRRLAEEIRRHGLHPSRKEMARRDKLVEEAKESLSAPRNRSPREAAEEAMGEGKPVLAVIFRVEESQHLEDLGVLMKLLKDQQREGEVSPVSFVIYGESALHAWERDTPPYCGLCAEREPEEPLVGADALMWESNQHRMSQGWVDGWMGLCGDCLEAGYDIRV